MKGLACPCPALPHFWQLGSSFMAESSRPQASRQGPPLSMQILRAQYEGLREQQKTQAHLMVFPKGGNTPTSAESMVSAVWVNKGRRSCLSWDEADPEVEDTLEEADKRSLQAPESPWRTHLEMHCLVQTLHRETGGQLRPTSQLVGSGQRLPPEGDLHLFENTQQGTEIPETARCHYQGGAAQTKAEEPSLKTSTQCLPSVKNPHRSGRPVHYPFPQRKAPRISQAARNLGLYGPV
ncbi:uncharacterized protein C9orf152 homolog [Ctenodactylus gundi]